MRKAAGVSGGNASCGGSWVQRRSLVPGVPVLHAMIDTHIKKTRLGQANRHFSKISTLVRAGADVFFYEARGADGEHSTEFRT